MPTQFDYQAARKAGYSDQELQQYIKQNPNVQAVGMPTPTQTQPMPTQPSIQQQAQLPYYQNGQQPQVQPKGKNNSLLDFLLPTAGGAIGAIGGALIPGADLTGIPEIAGGAAGAAGGQALADYLQGKSKDETIKDTALSGVLGLAGGGLGGIVAKGGAKIAAGIGEDLAKGGLNLTKSMTNKLSQTNGENVIQTLLQNKLAGANADTIDQKLSGLYKQQGNIAKTLPLDYDTFAANADKALSALKDSTVGSNKALYNSVNENIQNVLGKMADGNGNLDNILHEFDTATKQSQFGSSPWGANRYTGDILRKTMYDTADKMGMTGPNGESLQQMGRNLRNLQNISDAAAKREGMGGSGVFGLPNLFSGELGMSAAGALGANPLTGLLLPGMRLGTGLIRKSSGLSGVLSQATTGAGNIANKLSPMAGLAGILGGNSIAQNAIAGNQGQGNNNEQNGNQSPPLSSSSIPQSGSNSNTIKSFDGKSEFPATLPDISKVQNTIPGQPYSQDQYLQDVKTIQADMQRAANNPLAMQQLQGELQTVEAQKKANDDYVNQYVQQNGLDEQQQQFMKTAKVTYDNMNMLRGLIQRHSPDGLFGTVLQDNPAIQYIKVNQDPTGDYAKMVSLIGQLRGQAARAIQGGRPSNFDLQIYSSLDPKNSKAANLSNLDQSQKTMLEQYQQYAPLYGLSRKAQNQSSGGLTGNSQLDQILSPSQ